MKLPFRAWLADQNIDTDSQSLFSEALLCYQVGAYRAALVFSYLGFLRNLAQRLMTASPPTSIPQSIWDTLQRDIRNDGRWEIATFDSAIRSQPASIFLVDDDIRQQLQYWRGRRNDAAHSKGNEISYAHVESLWLFIRSNLNKFVVNGGRAGLLERFRRHFDPTYTPLGMDFSDLVRQIPECVAPLEQRDFLADVLGLPGVIDDTYPELTDIATALASYIEKLSNLRLNDAFAEAVKSEPSLFEILLLEKPNFILHYSGDPLLIRSVWHDLLLSKTRVAGVSFLSGGLRIFAVMLRNGLIPEGVQDTAIDHLVSRIWETDFHEGYPPGLLDELAPFGFWEAVRRHAFETPGSSYAASNLCLTAEYLQRYPVDVSIAYKFCSFFPREMPESDDDYAWWKATNLAAPEDFSNLLMFFANHPKIYSEIIELAEKHKVEHDHFQELMNPEDHQYLVTR
jgi:hypothetical protein